MKLLNRGFLFVKLKSNLKGFMVAPSPITYDSHFIFIFYVVIGIFHFLISCVIPFCFNTFRPATSAGEI